MGKLSAAEALQDNLKAVNVRFMGDNGAPGIQRNPPCRR